MQTITIRVHESVYEKVKGLLANFTREELVMEEESNGSSLSDAEYDEINFGKEFGVSENEAKQQVEEAYQRMISGKEQTYTMQELNNLLEETIRKYED